MKLLIIVDAQNDFVTGALANPDAQKAVPYIAEKLKKYANCEDREIIYTMDTHYTEEWYKKTREGKNLPIAHCIEGTDGWQICPEIDPRILNIQNYVVFSKGAFMLKDWEFSIVDEYCQRNVNIESIEIVGFCTDICVVSNALALVRAFQYAPNTRIIVDAKGCAGLTREKHLAALEVMDSCQIDIINKES